MKKIVMFFNKILMMLIVHATPSCQVITAKVSESLEHRLSIYERLMIRIHIMGCKLCARYRQQLLAMHKAVEQVSQKYTENGADRLSVEARQRIKQKLRGNGHHH